jgi:hypothetical protein
MRPGDLLCGGHAGPMVFATREKPLWLEKHPSMDKIVSVSSLALNRIRLVL